MNKYVADFETTTLEDDCRVWGWGIYSIEKDKFKYGKSIDDFFNLIETLPNGSTIYFHNLKFDGEFILYYLFRIGFKHTDKKKLNKNEFSTLISWLGQWYAMRVNIKGKVFHILDSLKIIPMKVSGMSKAFNIEQLKGEIDYTKERPIGYELNENEITYIKNDVEIVAKALKYFFNQSLDKMTQASNALMDYKDTIGGEKNFRKYFPILECDSEIRRSYRGGFTWANPRFTNKIINEIDTYDVNSLYPSVMYYENLPYGTPIFYRGEYQEDKIYNLYVQCFSCEFELKENHVPMLQIKNDCRFNGREYLTSSNGETVELMLTSIDLELFKEQYNIYNIEFHYGYKFKSTNKLFKKYIDKWTDVKVKAHEEGNNGLRTIAKLMLNALYGKFGTNPKVQSKIPMYDGEIVHLKNGEIGEKESIYIPVATFVTSYARRKTIESGQKNFERFLYADTDSLHLKGHEPPNDLDVHDTKLGAWKLEGQFKKGKFLRAKTYIEYDTKIHVTCAGLPKDCHDKITFDNFKSGTKIGGKLQAKRVKGGVILKEDYFTLKT